MRSSTRRTLIISLLGLASCFYLAAADGARWIDFEFPADSPVLVNSFSLGPTRAHVLGSSMALDLHALVVLRNTGTKPIAGLTLRVEAPGLSSAGKGSVTIPSLHAQPGDSFPVHIDMQLRRPFSTAVNSAVLKISLDCALFSDLTAYGPDTLGSHRALMVYELEARRDRQYVAYLLATGQLAELRRELNFGLQPHTARPGAAAGWEPQTELRAGRPNRRLLVSRCSGASSWRRRPCRSQSSQHFADPPIQSIEESRAKRRYGLDRAGRTGTGICGWNAPGNDPNRTRGDCDSLRTRNLAIFSSRRRADVHCRTGRVCECGGIRRRKTMDSDARRYQRSDDRSRPAPPVSRITGTAALGGHLQKERSRGS